MLASCIVPVWNGAQYLAAAIESILAQDHRPLEIVVVDDGSTDGSRDIAESFGEPVRVVSQQRSGAAAARNRGIAEAVGELICFLDQDDLYRPGKLSAQVRALREAPEADLCLCLAENFWEPGLEEEQRRYIAAGRMQTTQLFATFLATRSAFDRVGPLDATLPAGELGDWLARARELGLVSRVLPEVLCDRRMHAASMTHSGVTAEAFLELVKRRIDKARAEPLRDG